MAKKRMFSLQIVDTDAFLDMPLSTQALYFHLSMRADDDGFVNNPKKIMKMVGSQDDDLKVLLTKRFILGFDSGIIVIKHWRLNNYIRSDRYAETVYLDEKKQLTIKENGVYTELGIPKDNQMDTQYRLDKVRLDKNSKDKIPLLRKDIKFPNNDYKEIITNYETIKGVKFNGNEYKPIQQAIKSMFIAGRTKDQIIKCMRALNNSELDHWQTWNINTVKKQIPLFVSGKLIF